MGQDIFDTSEFEEQRISFTFKEEDFVLREATGEAERRFTNARTKAAKIGANGQIRELGDVGDLKPLLVHLCCFRDEGPKAGQQVGLAEIGKWPGRLVSSLFDKAKEISGFDEEDKLGEELSKALALEDAPCTLEDLREFVEGLDKDEYVELHELVKPSMEETAKNSQTATTDGYG